MWAPSRQNSTYTQERVLNYLKRNSNVIYPPTPTARFHSGKSTGYWLSVNRLIRHKRVDIQMKAFAMLPDEKLIILGPYERSGLSKEYAEYIAKICPPNVKLQPQADSFAELADYYANCKGFITTSYREGFWYDGGRGYGIGGKWSSRRTKVATWKRSSTARPAFSSATSRRKKLPRRYKMSEKCPRSSSKNLQQNAATGRHFSTPRHSLQKSRR